MKPNRAVLWLAVLTLLLAACGATDDPDENVMPATASFTLSIENVSDAGTLPVAEAQTAVPLSPGVWLISAEQNALFTLGEASSPGLAAIAEDGNASILSAALVSENADVFNTPNGADMPGPIGPGGSYSFSFQAVPGDALHFATMFIQSNDWFYAPGPDGVALFDGDDMPISGDISDQINLYDAGSEADEVPGLGENQAPRQGTPDTGDADPDNTVRSVAPPASLEGTVLETAVTSETFSGVTTFTVTLTNTSAATSLTPTLPIPLSPGVWTVGEGEDVLLTVGEEDYGDGLEGIAEDGTPGELAASLEGEVAQVGVFNTPLGASEPGPIFPGGSYEVTFDAEEGDSLNLTTMFIQSNDWVYATSGAGITLFENGEPVTGDVTDQLGLYDVGTEADETPGVGENQAPRQLPGGNVGDADPDMTVRTVDIELNGEVIRVSLSVN